MATIVAEFDGNVFVPQQPVDWPAGTKVTVALPTAPEMPAGPPRRPTEEERREWEQFRAELNRTDPYFPTVEDALGHSRKYPGYYP
jgi:hypothetical protein